MKVYFSKMSYQDFVDNELYSDLQYKLVTSDFHLGIHKNSENYNKELYRLLELAVRDTHGVIFLGDYFDKPKPSPGVLSSGRSMMMDLLSSEEDRTIMVAGNHTRIGDNELDPVDFIINNALCGVTAYSFVRPLSPQVIEAEANYHVIPYDSKYILEPEELIYELNNRPLPANGLANIALLHLPLSNAVFDNGELSVGCELPSDAFNRYDLVMLGDFHTPQLVKYFDVPVVYVGAPLQFNFSHRFEPCVRYLAIKKDDIYLVEVPSSTIMNIRKFVTLNLAKSTRPSVDPPAIVRVVGVRDETSNGVVSSLIEDGYEVLDTTTPTLPNQNTITQFSSDLVEWLDDMRATSGDMLSLRLREYVKTSLSLSDIGKDRVALALRVLFGD